MRASLRVCANAACTHEQDILVGAGEGAVALVDGLVSKQLLDGDADGGESRVNDLNNSKQAAVAVFDGHSQQVPRHETCSIKTGHCFYHYHQHQHHKVPPVFLSPDLLKYLHAYASGMLRVWPSSGKRMSVWWQQQ